MFRFQKQSVAGLFDHLTQSKRVNRKNEHTLNQFPLANKTKITKNKMNFFECILK